VEGQTREKSLRNQASNKICFVFGLASKFTQALLTCR